MPRPHQSLVARVRHCQFGSTEASNYIDNLLAVVCRVFLNIITLLTTCKYSPYRLTTDPHSLQHQQLLTAIYEAEVHYQIQISVREAPHVEAERHAKLFYDTVRATSGVTVAEVQWLLNGFLLGRMELIEGIQWYKGRAKRVQFMAKLKVDFAALCE